MANDAHRPGWTGLQRSDGTWVVVRPEGDWIVIAGDSRMPIFHCPCCKKPFATKGAAMLAADTIYPVKPPN